MNELPPENIEFNCELHNLHISHTAGTVVSSSVRSVSGESPETLQSSLGV